MSSNEDNPFDNDDGSSQHQNLSVSSEQPRKLKRLNRNAADSDEELFDQVEAAIVPKKEEKKQFAKKLMKMFYDGDDEERPKKQKKKLVQGKQTETKLKHLKKQEDSDEEQKERKQEAENFNPDQQAEENPSKRRKQRTAKKRKHSISGESESSVSDSVSMVPSSQPDDSAQYSNSGPRRNRQSKKQRLRKKNEQKLKEWQLKFSVEEKDDDVQPVAQGQAYYTGMEFTYNFATKKDKNAVKSRNKMFGDFQITQPETEGAPEVEPTKEQVEQLNIKVKEVPTRSITEFRFISKLNASRKARMDKPEIKAPEIVPPPVTVQPQPVVEVAEGSQLTQTQPLVEHQQPILERTGTQTSITVPFSIDDHSIRLNQQRRAKQSLMKMATSQHISHHDNVEFELAVSIPYLARGRSSQVLNNTIYLKKLSTALSQSQSNEDRSLPFSQQSSTKELQQSQSAAERKVGKGKISRSQFMSSIINEIKMRRSKFLSPDDIKESFKKTDLDQLELARQRLDKRKNDLMENIVGEDKQDSDYEPQKDSEDNQDEGEVVDTEKKVGDEEFKKLMELDADEDELAVEAIDEKPEEEQNEDDQESSQSASEASKRSSQAVVEKAAEAENVAEVQQQADSKQESAAAVVQSQMEVEQEENIAKKKKKKFFEDEDAQEQQNADDVLADNESDERSEHEEENSQDRDFIQEGNQQVQESDLEDEPVKKKRATSEELTPGRLLLKDNKQSMGMFKKLKNLAQKVLEKKQKKEIGMKMVNQLLDQEAELGSDNESNDDKKKAIDYEAEAKEYEGEDLDADLQELIDNAPYLLNEEDEQEAYQRFLRDQRMQEKEQLMRVIRGQFKKSKKQFMEGMSSDEDEKQRDERMEELFKRYKQQDEADDKLYYKQNEDEQGNSEQFKHPDELDEDQRQDYMEFFKGGLQKRQSQISQKSNPMELSIFSEPKSNSLGSTSLMLGLKNRSSLLSVASDKSRICSFEQAKLESGNRMKTSNLNKLYQKNVMASKTAVMLGLKRTNSFEQ